MAPRSLLALAIASVCALVSAAPALAGPLPAGPDATYVTDGQVDAVQRLGNTVYLGGAFSRVGPATGPGVPISASSGNRDASFPPISGISTGALNGMQVSTAVPDGSGGWYVGGIFSHVGGAARSNLVHVLSNDTVDPSFRADTDGQVFSLALSGSTLYVGGQYTHIGGVARNSLAAVDAGTGAVASWNPNPTVNSFVYALAVSGSTVYAGGTFTTIGGQSKTGLAALDATTGNASATFAAVGGVSGPTVRALAISGSLLYVGGAFTTLGASARNNAGAVTLSTGVEDATWNPNVVGGDVYALAVSGLTVYLGGVFSGANDINGTQQRNYLAAVSSASGAVTPLNLSPSFYVMGLSTDASGTVYAAGWFTNIGGKGRNHLAAIDSLGTVTAWDPGSNGNGQLAAFDATSGSVFTGGQFSSVNMQARSNLAAINVVDGTPTAWNPSATSALGGQVTVYALAASGSTVYVGGSFDTIGGQGHLHVAAVDASSGTPVAGWSGSASGTNVRTLLVSGSTLYVGGVFTTLDGQAFTNLGALNTADGSLIAGFAPNPDSDVYSLALSGSTLYVGGFFSNIGGQPRNELAAVDATAGTAIPGFDPNIGGQVYALVLSGSTLYFGGDFFSVNNGTVNRNYLAAVSTSTGTATAWDPSADSTVYALAQDTAGNLVIGGAFGTMGTQPMSGLAEVDPASGALTSWRPGSDGEVDALSVAPDGTLYVGGFFNTMDLRPQATFASFSQLPASTSAPQIAGAAQSGSVLDCANGGWTGSTPQSYAFSWLRDGSTIATGSTYTVTDADQGHALVCRVTASNVAGSTNADSAALAIPTPPAGGPPPPPPPPPLSNPIASKTVNLVPISGTVLVKVPGSKKFVPLTSPSQVQVGSIIDARKGRVRITIANGHGGFDTADFYEGAFLFTQPKVKPGRTAFADLFLVFGSFRGCPTAPKNPKLAGLSKSKHRSIRHLWGSGKGAFRTVGRFSSATVRGTTWLTDDRCDGTLTKVTVGKVSVRDFILRKTVIVKKGRSYFAKPRR